MNICYSTLTLTAFIGLLYVGNSNSQSTGVTCETMLLPGYDGCPPWENVPTYFPYPYDCRRFIECSNGYAIVQCCAVGTVWDQNLSVCNHEAFTPCVIVTTEGPSSPTSPTTTTPTTTTAPTTTTNPTTTPTPTTTTTPTTITTTLPPIINGTPQMLINVQANMVLDVYNGYLTDFTQIQTYHIGPNCSGIAEVWRLEFQTLTSTYIIRSALSGSNAWQHSMHTNGTAPYLHLGVSSDAYWFVVRVSGTNHWNIYNRDYNSTGRSSLRNTGITSGNGGRNLELAPLDPSDIAQRWELFVCP